MKCPRCGKPADILETRDRLHYVRRRYLCFNEHRFSTMEQVHEYTATKREQSPGAQALKLLHTIKELLK